ncbi:MAG: DNA-directed RNA polymerase subunit beta' [Armatimonadetes bacterium]|nr:DNA-directed RNA polymerase subunit beta' [Armatimonadota bacterium]
MAEASNFNKIRISLAAPDQMRTWSSGEVKKPETINYRTFKPERDGLFCERIFGPVRDWECHCGRYKKVKFKGVICDRCGVEVTKSTVRRQRMGHIELAAPVSHIWYLKGVPSPMALLLDISPRPLEKVIYFGSYIVTQIDRRRIGEEFAEIESAVHAEIAELRNAPEFPEDILEPVPLLPGEVDDELVEDEEDADEEDADGDDDAETAAVLPEEVEDATVVADADEETAEDSTEDVVEDTGTEDAVEEEEEEAEEDFDVGGPSVLEMIRHEGKDVEERVGELEASLKRLSEIQKRELITEEEWRGVERILEVATRRLGRDFRSMVRAGLGAAAIKEVLQEIDLEELSRQLRTEISGTTGPRRIRSIKRLEVVEAFLKSKTRPEWMILDVVTVIPPDLRPMVQLDGGRFATSDLNDLYRRIINRNNRLKKITEIRAPESIINHEKRLLQEAVDALIDNGRRSRPVVGSNNRPLRSLSDMLKGKEGRFRKNLLGKRVDYSGRSVIVVGPKLKLHQCGLPKEMALELFKPFVMRTLVEKNYTHSIKTAKRMLDRADREPQVWDALEEVIQDHPVLLNRAPTLHRLGIQAFEPVLVDGKAIQLHPLVCAAFGADFDGDQMAVHVPLSNTAQAEARLLMLSIRNLFRPSDGSPVVAPKQDMVLGAFYLTQENPDVKGAGLMFGNIQEALLAYETRKIHLHAPVKVSVEGRSCGVCGYFRPGTDRPEACTNPRPLTPDQRERLVAFTGEDSANGADGANGAESPNVDNESSAGSLVDVRCTAPGSSYGDLERQWIETTIGRLLMNQLFPDDANRLAVDGRPVPYYERSPDVFVNDQVNSKRLGQLIAEWYEQNAFARGSGWDATVKMLDEMKDFGFRYATQSGITVSVTDMEVPEERNEIVNRTQSEVDKQNRAYRRGLISQGEREQKVLRLWTDAADQVTDAIVEHMDELNPVNMIVGSGARGSRVQLRQLSGMRGLMSDPFGKMIEDLPIKSNFHEGLNVLEYFISTHGQRKGLADTALRTADAGYLTRRLVDVAQDVIVREHDCGTSEGVFVEEIEEGGDTIEPLADRLSGRVTIEDVLHPETGGVIIPANTYISSRAAEWVESVGVKRVGIRSPFTCSLSKGICSLCYGMDMGRHHLVEVGTAVGIIAAQSIGEPGTQLTMRTFHTGGVAGKSIAGVAGVKRRRQETLKELHEDARRGIVSLGSASAEREKNKAIQAMLKVLEDQVQGLLRVVELVEARRPKGQAIITELPGVVEAIEEKGGLPQVIIRSELDVNPDRTDNLVGYQLAEHLWAGATPPEGLRDQVNPETGEIVEDPNIPAPAIPEGTDITDKIGRQIRELGYTRVPVRRSYLVPYRGASKDEQGRIISAGRIRVGQQVQAGDRLTEGPLDPQKVLELQGLRGVQEYMVREIQSVYRGQSVDINDKHIEVIVRQMLRKRRILEPGDTEFLPGAVLDKWDFEAANRRVENMDPPGRAARAEPLLLGITEASLATDSFLSAASFQKTTKVLAEAAIRGKEDSLIGLKENVIIGRLIPAGTGLAMYAKSLAEEEAAAVDIPLKEIDEERDQEIADLLRSELGATDITDLGDLSDFLGQTTDLSGSDAEEANLLSDLLSGDDGEDEPFGQLGSDGDAGTEES